ncbi:MAG: alpha-glucosidase C-terminal domain-containing protein [Prolixibacteraceae bacterium]|nr:alpha-glucosidase C-terminal domain-containing protein [Prolixibacteraceae bacterium]
MSIHTIILILWTMFATSCDKDDPMVIKPPHGEDDEPASYQPVPLQKLPETSDVVMYEVNLRAFSNEGTLDGVSKRLDSIKALGANVVWLMPIHPIGEEKGVGSPYCIRDYKAVNPEFGKLTDLRELVDKAHTLGLAVILDWVGNHTAWDHPWINNIGWYTTDASGNIVEANGWTDVADLNFNNHDMRAAMTDAMQYWLDSANVDGFRCDYADGVPVDFWTNALTSLRGSVDRQLLFFAEGTRKENFSAGFDLNFGWSVYGSIKGIIAENKAASGLFSAHERDYQSVPTGKHMLHFITNHDDNAWDNTPDKLFLSQRGAMAAFVSSTFVGGVPLLYNGQEIGYPYKLSFFTKTPINWSLNPGITTEYKKLLQIRHESEAIRKGTLKQFTSTDVVAFQRIAGDETVLVLVNVRNRQLDFPLPDDLKQTVWVNQMSRSEVQLGSEVQLAPFEYLILR